MSVVWLVMVSALAMAATLAELCRFSVSVNARVDRIADSKLIRLHAVELYGSLITGGELLLGPSASIICVSHLHKPSTACWYMALTAQAS